MLKSVRKIWDCLFPEPEFQEILDLDSQEYMKEVEKDIDRAVGFAPVLALANIMEKLVNVFGEEKALEMILSSEVEMTHDEFDKEVIRWAKCSNRINELFDSGKEL